MIFIILAAMCETPQRTWTQKELASKLKISQAEISNALNRMEKSKLYDKKIQSVKIHSFLEFLKYGLPYVLHAEPRQRS